MRRVLCICLVGVLMLGVLTGCQSNNEVDGNHENEGTQKLTKALSDFSTTDLKGNAVTDDLFEKSDITMIDIWATWCGACVDEMEGLQKVYEKTKEKSNINMITICEDMDEKPDMVKKILKDNKCEFITIRPDKSMREGLLSEIQYFPTTIFVDKDGFIIGEPLIGAPAGDISEFYLNAIDERVATINK